MLACRIVARTAALLLAGLIAGSASAAPLPGGASSLTESYDDWSVVCQMQNNAPACAVRQVQAKSQTNQHVLTAEITKAPDGKYRGGLLLPLGLALAPGAQLKIDDAALGATQPFSVCVQQGCLVPLAFETEAVNKLKAGKTLTVTVGVLGQTEPVVFTISLKGLSSALNRVADLTK